MFINEGFGEIDKPKKIDLANVSHNKLINYALAAGIVALSIPLAMKFFRDRKAQFKSNPKKGKQTQIYDRIIEIKAQKGNDSLWPREKFRHVFKKGSRAQILGNPDGSLTIRSLNGTNLWKRFKY